MHSATELATRSIKVMMESGCEEELIKAKDDTNDTMKKLRKVDKTCSQLQQNLEKRCFVNTSLEEKLWNLEDENHVPRQKALSSPKGSRPGFVKPFLEKYSAALALPYADQKPVFESPTPTKLIAPLSQGLSDSRKPKLTTERQQASQASLEWLMKKRKAFDRRGDMVVATWAEQQQQQHEMNLRVHRLSRSKE